MSEHGDRLETPGVDDAETDDRRGTQTERQTGDELVTGSRE